MRKFRRPAATFVAWWLALAWLWLLLVGAWDALEWMAAASAGMVSAVAAVVVRRVALHDRVRLAWLAGLWSVPGQVVADFALLLAALARTAVRRRPVEGAFRERPVRGPRERGGVAALLATYAPNAYVLELDADREVAVVHELVPRRTAERPL